MDNTLFTNQYSTSPAGKKKKNTLKTTGMIFITLACTGSGGSGLSRVCMIMVAPISKGNINHGSGLARSVIHNVKGAWRNSTLASKTQYNAIKTGICTTIGMQPPSGFICSVLYNSI